MSVTARLALPYIAPQQAQKQVTYNEAMALLDLLVQPAVKSRSVAAPPASPGGGDGYIVAPAATGLWTGHDGDLAVWLGAWEFRSPGNGWLAFVEDDAEIAICQSGGWTTLVTNGGAGVSMFGINTAPDLSNRLAVASAQSLFTHDGTSHRLTLNKAAAGDTASVVFADNYSGRAEFGLTGDDAFHIKVSADGASWLEALTIAPASAALALGQGQLTFPATQNASADAHTLDDYLEGSFTPLLQFGGGATGMSYATQLGRYTKIGRHVTATGTITLSAKGSATGVAELAGLPFAPLNDGNPASCAVGFAVSFASVTGAVLGLVQPAASRIGLYQSANGAAAALSDASLTNTASLSFTASYDTA
ncbi:MAG: DUF2793 domain-containing protein [Devosia sp.]